jgi:glycerol-3-phosphate acyltransferase PlsY
MGATNAGRAHGAKGFIFVIVGDVLKVVVAGLIITAFQ